MDYRSVAEARTLPGLRLVLSAGVAGPWGESAKGIFHVKGLNYIPVAQEVGGDNLDLVAWAGVRNAPVAVYDAEKPRDRWLDILVLAERLQPKPALLPADPDQRALVVGISHEICGEHGFGWSRRNMMSETMPPSTDGRFTPTDRIRQEYGCTAEAAATAPGRCVEILTMLARRLKAQRAQGSSYLVGPSLTAADVYWACFSALIDPLPAEVNPMPAFMRDLYTAGTPDLVAAKDPILMAHRDMIYQRHLKLPLDY